MPLHVINTENTDPQVAIYKRKTILTDAQIKALPTTPVELVPAPGEGRMIHVEVVIISAILQSVYGNISTDGYLSPTIGGGEHFDMLANIPSGTQHLSALLANIQDNVYRFYKTISTAYQGAPTVDSYSFVENTAVSIMVYNAAGDFTGGDPANTLEVTVFYSIVDL